MAGQLAFQLFSDVTQYTISEHFARSSRSWNRPGKHKSLHSLTATLSAVRKSRNTDSDGVPEGCHSGCPNTGNGKAPPGLNYGSSKSRWVRELVGEGPPCRRLSAVL